MKPVAVIFIFLISCSPMLKYKVFSSNYPYKYYGAHKDGYWQYEIQIMREKLTTIFTQYIADNTLFTEIEIMNDTGERVYLTLNKIKITGEEKCGVLEIHNIFKLLENRNGKIIGEKLSSDKEIKISRGRIIRYSFKLGDECRGPFKVKISGLKVGKKYYPFEVKTGEIGSIRR